MKNTLFVLLLFIGVSFNSNAQLEPTGWKKLCLGDRVNSVMDMKYRSNLLFVKLEYGSELVAMNTETEEIAWKMKYPKQYYVGYGLHTYGDQLMFYSTDNKFDSKNKLIQLTWLMFIKPENGNKLDSVKCNFSIVSLSDSPGKSGLIGAIKMGTDNKYSATLINHLNGEVKLELLKENSKIAGNPNVIKIDHNEKYAAVGTANGKQGFYLFDFTSGKQLMNLTGEGDIHNVEFTSDSKYCFYVQKKKLIVINLETLKMEKQIALPVDGVYATLNSDNENLAVTGFGTKSQVIFVNWKNEKIIKSDLSTAGGKSEFNDLGELYVCQATYALDCKVSKDASPYLAKFSFKNAISTLGTNTNTQNVNSTNSSTLTFTQGSRAFILYAGDKKYYSGTITEESSSAFGVVFDDGTIATVKKSEVKALPELKVGDGVQALRSDKKLYNASILSIKGQVAQLKFSNTVTEWIPVRNIMQIE